MTLHGSLSLCSESPVGIGEKLSWRGVAAPVLLWSDGHPREGQSGAHFFSRLQEQKKQAEAWDWMDLALSDGGRGFLASFRPV